VYILFYYAEIDENSVCKAVLETGSIIEEPHMIAIESYDTSILGKIYNPENNTWSSNPTIQVPSTPSLEEKIDALGIMLAQLMLK
jgi:hypothetical protein